MSNDPVSKMTGRTEQHVRDVMSMRERAAETVLDFCRSGATPAAIATAIRSLTLFPDTMNQRGNR
jgi:hypothetical protein